MYHEYFKVSDGFTLIEPEPSMRERIHDAIYNEVYEIKDLPAGLTVQVRLN
jgi:hypothetical protein